MSRLKVSVPDRRGANDSLTPWAAGRPNVIDAVRTTPATRQTTPTRSAFRRVIATPAGCELRRSVRFSFANAARRQIVKRGAGETQAVNHSTARWAAPANT